MKKYVDFESLEERIASLTERLEELENNKATLEDCYPVGAIYVSTVSTNPKTLFGFGTWTQIKDRFLLGAGSSYSAGSTGGASTVALSKTQVPKVSGLIAMHSQGVATNIHDVQGCFSSGLTNDNKYRAGGTETTGAPSIGRINFDNGGTGAAHNNMPPYLTVYIFQRTE